MNFEEIAEQYAPMITRVLQTARVYRNYEDFRHIARIGLWEALERYDATKGDFAPFAFRTMLTKVYTEMSFENKYAERFIPYEKDALTGLAQEEVQDDIYFLFEDLQEQLKVLTNQEFQLLVDLYYHRYSYDELTAKYKIKKAALKKRRDRIMKKVREEMWENKC